MALMQIKPMITPLNRESSTNFFKWYLPSCTSSSHRNITICSAETCAAEVCPTSHEIFVDLRGFLFLSPKKKLYYAIVILSKYARTDEYCIYVTAGWQLVMKISC